ncbi:molybdopterin synthase sulfur carrier subunit, partial [Salmonella enterica]|nr:molybdopterin synthase sulfur carrier subunit [Salmonella enterica]ECY8244725.1 molybdopterin synthase sulfur carrier subunit [Salmonella enterica subsp. enterica serovar Remo]
MVRCACWRKAAANRGILRWMRMIKVLFFAQVRELTGT